MLEMQSDNTNSLDGSSLVNAAEILKDVKASYAAFSKKDFGSYDKESLDFKEDSIESDNTSNISNILEKSDDVEENKVPESNCLALTVRKDYNLTILKNIVTTGRQFNLENCFNYSNNKCFKYIILKNVFIVLYKYVLNYSIFL